MAELVSVSLDIGAVASEHSERQGRGCRMANPEILCGKTLVSLSRCSIVQFD